MAGDTREKQDEEAARMDTPKVISDDSRTASENEAIRATSAPDHGSTRLHSMRRVLKTIARDMEADAARFDGMPFNGRTVAEYFGNQGAAIAGIAKILEEICDEALLYKSKSEASDGW